MNSLYAKNIIVCHIESKYFPLFIFPLNKCERNCNLDMKNLLILLFVISFIPFQLRKNSTPLSTFDHCSFPFSLCGFSGFLNIQFFLERSYSIRLSFNRKLSFTLCCFLPGISIAAIDYAF